MPDINTQIPVEDGMQIPMPLQREEQDSETDRLFSQLEEEYRKFNSNLIVMKNKIEQARIQTLRRVFEMMKNNGIDPNNPEQLGAFMERISEIDPDFLALFETAMDGLLSGEQFDLSQVPETQAPIEEPTQEGGIPAETPSEQFPELVQQ